MTLGLELSSTLRTTKPTNPALIDGIKSPAKHQQEPNKPKTQLFLKLLLPCSFARPSTPNDPMSLNLSKEKQEN
ncbi:hypothetical protein IC582_008954 [Cucumis melo]|uniref:Uncharacterized protein n=1 Tax=Cucumis melo TaxID=3656 RepID=A0A9I9EAB2_CUCME